MRIEELEIQHTNGKMNYPCWFSNTCDVSETGPDQLTTRVKKPLCTRISSTLILCLFWQL